MNSTHHLVTRTALAAAGGAVGLVVAGVVVLNLHILAGPDQGYGASPQEVWNHSVVLALSDIALLVAGVVVGAITLWRRPPVRRA